MPGNQLGKALILSSWGESHGSAIGGVLDGFPPGIELSLPHIQEKLDQRRPGGSNFVSPRHEEDKLQILSGMFEGKTLGTPLAFLIQNTAQNSKDYTPFETIFRPGHADYTYYKKYGHVDYRGGGRSSARETAIRVVAGAISLQLLHFFLGSSLKIRSALVQLGSHKLSDSLKEDQWDWDFVPQNPLFCPDPAVYKDWQEYLLSVKLEGKSVGALVETHVYGLPAGLGEPVYDKLDADLAKALMSINAVKAVEIGDGFDCVTAEHGYDEMGQVDQEVSFLSNKAGGILGGISTGQPLICRIALKPTSSTHSPRQTLTKDLTPITIPFISGRHDPCVGIRAVPIAEAMVAFTLADHYLRWRGQCGTLNLT